MAIKFIDFHWRSVIVGILRYWASPVAGWSPRWNNWGT